MLQELPPLSPCSETSLPSPSEDTAPHTPRDTFLNNHISLRQRRNILSESNISAPGGSSVSLIPLCLSAPSSPNCASFPISPRISTPPRIHSFRKGSCAALPSEKPGLQESNPFPSHPYPDGIHPFSQFYSGLDARSYSNYFPRSHLLNPDFVRTYRLGDELGHGAFGFVMTALHRAGCFEVAVKFIIKKKVPEGAWVRDEVVGRVPTEVMLLNCLNHDGIVKCYDVFEDNLYFYLVQELHGTPWPKAPKEPHAVTSPAATCLSLPALSPGTSVNSLLDHAKPVSPRSNTLSDPGVSRSRHPSIEIVEDDKGDDNAEIEFDRDKVSIPKCYRRPSHDLFECIEQSPLNRFTEDQARHVFAQVVEVVHYLDQRGIAHRDIKDENLLIDHNLHVKLIDFGSATIADPALPRPFHTVFYGTTAYASPEVLWNQPYQAEPAEIWTLGVLLSFLLTGMSPFTSRQDTMTGRMSVGAHLGISDLCVDLLKRCLELDPAKRADIEEVRGHPWLMGER